LKVVVLSVRNLKHGRWPLIFAALLLAFVSGSEAASGQDAAVGARRSDDAPIVIPIIAFDKEGRPATSLKPEDLRVVVDGLGQKIINLSQQSNEPLHVVVMIDASTSQEHILSSACSAAVAFITSSMRQGRDDATRP
jgi:hypothetical protein